MKLTYDELKEAIVDIESNSLDELYYNYLQDKAANPVIDRMREGVAILIGPGSGLEPTGYNDHAPLAKILTNEFAGLSPRNTVKKIGLLLSAFLTGKVSFHGDRESGDSGTTAGTTQFRVTNHATHNYDMIEHYHSPIRLDRGQPLGTAHLFVRTFLPRYNQV